MVEVVVVVEGANVVRLREFGGKFTHQNFPSSGPGVRAVVGAVGSVGAGVTTVKGNISKLVGS